MKSETYPGSTGASSADMPTTWPTYGIITFESVSLTYPDTGVRALRSIYCCFRAYEKVWYYNASPAAGLRDSLTLSGSLTLSDSLTLSGSLTLSDSLTLSGSLTLSDSLTLSVLLIFLHE